MPTIIEELPELIQVLRGVPFVGRILVALGIAQGFDKGQPLEEMLRVEEDKKNKRKTRIKENGRYVLKASDAMQCVEDHLAGNNGYARAFIRSLFSLARGKGFTASAPDILADEIFACIEKKVLSQKSKRATIVKQYSARPAVGHNPGKKTVVKSK